MDELDKSNTSSSGTTIGDPGGGLVFDGSVNFSIQPKTTIFRYTSPSTGKCYQGDFSIGFQLLQEV